MFKPTEADNSAALAAARFQPPRQADPAEQARLERAKSRSVMIATPVARDPAIQYTLSLVRTLGLLTHLGIRHGAEFIVGSSNLPRSRNGLAARFLASDFTDLIFIDDDMGWDPGSLVRLLASDKPLIGAAGRKKSPRPNEDPQVWCAQFAAGPIESDAMGAVRVDRLGGAFVKIERSVFEAMIAARPDWKRGGHEDMTADHAARYYQFFRFDTDREHEEIGEDYLFCDRWRAIGGQVWADPSIRLTHVGPKEYSGRLIEILQPVAAAAAAARDG